MSDRLTAQEYEIGLRGQSPKAGPSSWRAVWLSLWVAFTLSLMAASTADAATRHGVWTSQIERPDRSSLCYVAGAPLAREPKGLRRDPAFVHVALSKTAGISGEISLKLGFPLKHGVDVIVTVDAAHFRLFASGERAFVADPAIEARLLEAMRRGQRLVVTATSDRGTQTRDTYVLAGFADALKATVTGCT